MLSPLLLVVAAPHVFVEAVDHRLAGTTMHVTDWWADDLDGDHVPEAIALVCDDHTGFVVVQHGTTLLEAPLQLDGRNDCGAAARPAWTTRHAGEIAQSIHVHHGEDINVYAIRDGQLVWIREEGHGFDVNRDGSHDDQDMVTDYDELTWTLTETPGTTPGSTTTRAALVVATPHAVRSTPIVGKTLVSATWSGDQLTLHVQADRSVALRACADASCTPTKLGRGDADVPVTSDDVQLIAGGKTYAIHIEHIDVDQRFPPPPKA